MTEPRCKSSPHCSHNTNGRDLSKPCSIEFPQSHSEPRGCQNCRETMCKGDCELSDKFNQAFPNGLGTLHHLEGEFEQSFEDLTGAVWLFIASEIASAEARGREEVYGKLGFLRQWLNEDRITDPNKMVSTEELQAFLSRLTPPTDTL